jgi:hypothetical protein
MEPQMTYSNVYSRGQAEPGDVVHLWRSAKRPGVTADYPACYNGNWHIWWTDDPERVTCKECQKVVETKIK